MRVPLTISVDIGLVTDIRAAASSLEVSHSELVIYLLGVAQQHCNEADLRAWAAKEQLDPGQRATLDALRAANGWQLLSEIRAVTRRSSAAQRRALEVLVEAGYAECRLVKGEETPEMIELRARELRGPMFWQWRMKTLAKS